MIIKVIRVECPECGYYDEATDGDEQYDMLHELEHCPGCIKILAEKI